MSREYKQVKYRAAEGRFDGSLNKMAVDGWAVVSIDRVDELFLVTYVRERQGTLKKDECGLENLDEVLAANQKVGNQLVHMVGTTQRPHNDFIYTLVWEITDPRARQPRYKLSGRT